MRRRLVLWTMLAVLPGQDLVEREFTRPTDTAAKAARALTEWPIVQMWQRKMVWVQKAPLMSLLANRCVRLFAEHTSLAVLSRRVTVGTHSVRVVVCPFEETLQTGTPDAFLFGPSYYHLLGLDAETGRYSATQLKKERAALVELLLRRFWHAMTVDHHYVPSPSLHSKLSQLFGEFFLSGLSNTRAQALFLPQLRKRMTVYLHGIAGVGKSSFVRALHRSLSAVLTTYLDPCMLARVVKVDLVLFRRGCLV